jgi:protein involved in polysaccharide export with SLBB domain
LVDNNGGFHLHESPNGQDVTGVSLTTCTEYHLGGGDVVILNGQVGTEQTFSNTSTLIGEGIATNLVLHFEGHMTVNADGTVTAIQSYGAVVVAK